MNARPVSSRRLTTRGQQRVHHRCSLRWECRDVLHALVFEAADEQLGGALRLLALGLAGFLSSPGAGMVAVPGYRLRVIRRREAASASSLPSCGVNCSTLRGLLRAAAHWGSLVADRAQETIDGVAAHGERPSAVDGGPPCTMAWHLDAGRESVDEHASRLALEHRQQLLRVAGPPVHPRVIVSWPSRTRGSQPFRPWDSAPGSMRSRCRASRTMIGVLASVERRPPPRVGAKAPGPRLVFTRAFFASFSTRR